MAKQPSLRATRIALVTSTLLARRAAAKHAAHTSATLHANQHAYMLEVQQVSAKYGMPVPNTMSVRPFNKRQQHAPSAQSGACARVHSIAVQCQGVRSATLAACKAEGINPATAATQYAKWHKAQQTTVSA